MEEHDLPSDDSALRQLEALFHSADAANSGLLSFSEFAYLILKSGGTQEQADALIDQFSVSSRAQRMVCYAALLDHLRDSVHAKQQQEQQQQQQRYYYRDGRGGSHEGDAPSPLPAVPAALHDRHDHGTLGASATASRCSETFAYPQRSTTQAGERVGPSSSRETSATSYSDYGPYTRTQRPHMTASVRRSPSTPSQRLVSSALRAAQFQGTPTRTRTSPSAVGDDGNRLRDERSLLRYDAYAMAGLETDQRGPERVTRGMPSSRGGSGSRESSVVRMTQAAKEAHLRSNAATRTGASLHVSSVPDTFSSRNAAGGGPQRQVNTSVLSSSGRSNGVSKADPTPSAPHGSVLSSSTAYTGAGKPSLLSLRDVFHHHVLPAASARGGDESDTILLSELEDLFLSRGVEVHPLELEAVADSLELAAAAAAAPPASFYSSTIAVDESALAGGSASFVGPHNTTVTSTGGADCALGLVDFCVLVSRLRPRVIQRIRSPDTWWGAAAAPAASAAIATPLHPSQQHQYRHVRPAEGASAEEGDEPSITDVTVSPMTPPTANATPQSHSRPRRRTATEAPQQRAVQSGRDTAPLSYRHQGSLYADTTTPPPSPPTARQLSSDRHFAVDAAAAADERATYAQPTTSSYMHQRERREGDSGYNYSRSGSGTSHRAVLRHTKAAVWHGKPRSSASAHDRWATAAARTRPASTSPLSSSALSSRSQSQRTAEPRRVSVSIESPASRASHSPTSTGRSPRRLPPYLLDALQAAAPALLSNCTQMDRRRSGCVPPQAWSELLRRSCPALTASELRTVESHVSELGCRHHATPRGDAYAAVIEDILTQGGAGGSPPAMTPSSAATRTPASMAASSPSPSPARSPPYHEPRPGPVRDVSDSPRLQRLRRELLSACGGDTEALRTYMLAFDEAQRGHLHERVWRTALRELYRRTAAAEAPAWVLTECDALSRRPFELLASRNGAAAFSSSSSSQLSAAERAAVARARQTPPHQRRSLCDYLYVLQKLGLEGSTHER